MVEYKRFGVMLDMSRNAVMKVEEVKHFIDLIKKFGYNALGLYLEDTYEIEGEKYFGYLRGRYSAQELKDIDDYAYANGVEVIPYIQTLAHLTNITRHQVYDEIIDIDDILLIDEPKTYDLIDKMLKTCSNTFRSKNINIGMDEAFNVGLGKYLKQHGYCDRYEVILRHLNKVVDIAKKYELKPNMWSDMFFRIACGDYYVPTSIPEEVKKLVPENIGLEYWDYYHKDKELYDKMFKSHKEFNREVSFAGGAWSWHGFAPLSKFSINTMKPAMQSVIDNGIKNVMITMWGDAGHECSVYSLLHVLYAIRQYADGEFDDSIIAQKFKEDTGFDFDGFMTLDLPNLFNKDEILDEPHNPCRVLLYQDIFMGYLDKNYQNNGEIPYGEYAKIIAKESKNAGEFKYVFDTYEKLCLALEIKAGLGLKLRNAYKTDKNSLKELLPQIKELQLRVKDFHKAFSYLWHKENKPYGFEIHDARLGGLLLRLETCYNRLNDYLIGNVDRIPELEEEILPVDDGKLLRHHSYAAIISHNGM